MVAQNSLLSQLDRKRCEQILTRTDIHGQRAKALLALDDGASRAEAAEQASLSPGQVRYALARYKKLGLGIFPEDVLALATEKKDETPEPDFPVDAAETTASAVPSADIEAAEETVKAEGASPQEEKQPKTESKKPKKDKKKKNISAPFVVEKSVGTNTRATMKCVGSAGTTK